MTRDERLGLQQHSELPQAAKHAAEYQSLAGELEAEARLTLHRLAGRGPISS